MNKSSHKFEDALSKNVIFMKFDQMNQNFLKPSKCSQPLTDSFFLNPFTLLLFYPSKLSESFSKVPTEGVVETSSKSHISHIYHDFEFARTAPPTKALEEPSKNPRRQRGVPGVSLKRKKNKYYCNVEIFQVFHHWEARVPSTYYPAWNVIGTIRLDLNPQGRFALCNKNHN